MNISIIDNIPDSSVYIQSLLLECIDGQMSILLKVYCNSKKYSIICKNVRGLSLKDLVYPAHIEGFQIVDNLDKGWQSDVRFKVYDFEENIISFFCQSLNIELENNH